MPAHRDLAPGDAAIAQQVLAPALIGEVRLEIGERLGQPRDDGVRRRDRHLGRQVHAGEDLAPHVPEARLARRGAGAQHADLDRIRIVQPQHVQALRGAAGQDLLVRRRVRARAGQEDEQAVLRGDIRRRVDRDVRLEGGGDGGVDHLGQEVGVDDRGRRGRGGRRRRGAVIAAATACGDEQGEQGDGGERGSAVQHGDLREGRGIGVSRQTHYPRRSGHRARPAVTIHDGAVAIRVRTVSGLESCGVRS